MKCLASLMAVCILLGSAKSEASTAPLGQISSAVMLSGGVFMVYPSTAITSSPACNTQQRYSVNATTPAGQANMSALLSAFMARKPVTIVGTGACTDWGDSEAIQVFYINP